MISGSIRVREMSGKFKFFQGQGILCCVREKWIFSKMSGKCQGILKFPVGIKWWETENDMGSLLNFLDIS